MRAHQAHWDLFSSLFFEGQRCSNGWMEADLWVTSGKQSSWLKTLGGSSNPRTTPPSLNRIAEQSQAPSPGGGRQEGRRSSPISPQQLFVPAAEMREMFEQHDDHKQTQEELPPPPRRRVNPRAKLCCHRYKRSDSFDAFLGSRSL